MTLTPDQQTDLKHFYNQLEYFPLEPDDPRYVPFLEQGSDYDPIESLWARIVTSEAASVNLLSGQRGSGKSTELRRLRKKLIDEGCVVLLCDMQNHLNLTQPLEISDFMISLMVAFNLELKAIYGQDCTRRSYWDRLIEFLSQEVQIKDLKLEGELAEPELLGGKFKVGIGAALRDDPSFKTRLQEHLRGHVVELIRQAHGFAAEAVQSIRQRDGDRDRKVVLLVDSMEQIRGVGTEAHKVHESVENLFAAHADMLRIPLLHVVYTIPPYLPPLVPAIGQILGGNPVCNLPSVHIRDRNGSPDPVGLTVMRQILEKRHTGYREILLDGQVDRLALSAGGDFRGFFRLVRDCLIKALTRKTLPVPEAAVIDAENHLRREMLPLAEDDKDWLRHIAQHQECRLPNTGQLPRLARFFDTHLVYNYRNGEDWYDVHPLLRSELGA
ncbi:AAA ATPase domain-containing protein [Methylomagnum ishizawai]|uniref:AAA ATPase domain-containing protein n=1 Tax=Methylomagnum ishizawai TaxID=1760988 RepID=A0A1Y6CZN4_9GAMM|nr:AAA family ATPase [Methylomagnum ishizawai]SMF95847.1 AAA ATPase domain-containing protein [Methylomagnum ishizawai]